MIEADIHDAKRRLAKLLRRFEAGEEVVITEAGNPVARLIAMERPKPKPAPGSWLGSFTGEVWYAPDYDQADAEIERLFNEGDPPPST